MNNFKSIEFNAGVMYSHIESKMKVMLPKDSRYSEVDVEITFPRIQLLPQGHCNMSHSDVINDTCRIARLQFEDVYGEHFGLSWKKFEPKSPHGKQYITIECTLYRKNAPNKSEPIELVQFLKHKTSAAELCIIRESGYAVATFWIDYEDLFVRYLDRKLGKMLVIGHEWGTIRTVDKSGNDIETVCHYIDVE